MNEKNNKTRLDKRVLELKLANTRSQAENYIRLGKVLVNNKEIEKAGFLVSPSDKIELILKEKYVSRAGLKLASIAKTLELNFRDKIVLDVGSSTGGFTDYALKHGAKMVYAVDVGTDQLHPSLRTNEKVKLFEKTDIRDFKLVNEYPDIILIDVSFISLREILPYLFKNLVSSNTKIVAMLKPQFEAGKNQTNKGVIKNSSKRRQILKDFEIWVKKYCVILNKRDSEVAGANGNLERFYLLKTLRAK